MHDQFDPDLFDEHDGDGRGLDNEIDDSPRMGFAPDEEHEQGNISEIVGGAMMGLEQDAILLTLGRARDTRRPCPPMKAVDLDAPLPDEDDLLGAIASPDAFPITAGLMEAWQKAARPRIVRVDTEESYQAFRDAGSPERLALLSRLAELEGKLHAHLTDPDAHNPEVEEDLADAQALAAADDAKQIPLRMPRHFDGLMEAWHQGDMAAASMLLPRRDGGRWVATTAEPLKKGELEAAKAAAEAGVPAAAIVGYLTAIGATLSAADGLKALASGADDKPGTILKRPEAHGTAPFMVRLESQASPAIFALGELLCLCQAGNAQACSEWNRLAQGAPLPVRQAMGEVLLALKPPASGVTAIGGAVGDFFKDIWHKVRGLFGGGGGHQSSGGKGQLKAGATQALAAAAAPKALPARASA